MSRTLEAGIKVILSAQRADGWSCSAGLYRHASGEATPEETAAFVEHMRRCEHCRRDLGAFEREQAQAVASPVARSWWARKSLHALLGAFAAASLIVGVLHMRRTDGVRGDALQVKGGYRIHVAVRRQERSFTAGPDDRYLAGDVLGFFYTAPAPARLALYLAEPDGRISRLFPELPTNSTPLPAATQARLDLGAEVDSSSQCQWLVAFFAPAGSSVSLVTLESSIKKALANADGSLCRLGPLAPKGVATDIAVMKVDSR